MSKLTVQPKRVVYLSSASHDGVSGQARQRGKEDPMLSLSGASRALTVMTYVNPGTPLKLCNVLHMPGVEGESWLAGYWRGLMEEVAFETRLEQGNRTQPGKDFSGWGIAGRSRKAP